MKLESWLEKREMREDGLTMRCMGMIGVFMRQWAVLTAADECEYDGTVEQWWHSIVRGEVSLSGIGLYYGIRFLEHILLFLNY